MGQEMSVSWTFILYPIIQELGMVTVGCGDAGDCCQLVDGADTIRISWSGEHDDDDHFQVVLMSSRIEVNSTQQFSSHVLLITRDASQPAG